MKNVMKLIKKYKNLIKYIIYLSEHLKFFTIVIFKSSAKRKLKISIFFSKTSTLSK